MADIDFKQQDQTMLEWLVNPPSLQLQQVGQNPKFREAQQGFAQLAQQIGDNIPQSPYRTQALQKLIEAQDAVIRAHVSESASR